jgi:hypothetical protein
MPNALLFQGTNFSNQLGLWETDGMASGIFELAPIAGADATTGLSPSNMTAFKGEALFEGVNASGQFGLWEISPSDKAEIMRLVEQSPLAARRTLEKLGNSQIVFLPLVRSVSARRTRSPRGSPLTARSGLEPYRRGYPQPNCRLGAGSSRTSARGMAVRFTNDQGYFVSEASVYRLLKAHDLITSPAYIVIKAAEAFKDKTTAPICATMKATRHPRSGVGGLRSRSNDRCSPTAPAVG